MRATASSFVIDVLPTSVGMLWPWEDGGRMGVRERQLVLLARSDTVSWAAGIFSVWDAVANREVIEGLASASSLTRYDQRSRKQCTPHTNSYWNGGVYGVVSNYGGAEGKENSEDWNGQERFCEDGLLLTINLKTLKRRVFSPEPLLRGTVF